MSGDATRITKTYGAATTAQPTFYVLQANAGGGAGYGNAIMRIDNRSSNDFLSFDNNGTNEFNVLANGETHIAGNVGIGTTGPVSPLTVVGGAGIPSLTANTNNISTIWSSTAAQLTTGAINASPWSVWMQVKDATNNGGAYPLALNPLGGNVGIGTTAPDKKLEINLGTADALRLTYNDANGSATVYTDFTLSSGGVLNIAPTGLTATVTGRFASTATAVTVAAAATTFAVASNVVTVTGDAGANTVATITGGVSGQTLILLFVDALVTITDTAATTANTVNLSAAFTSAANTTLTLVNNGNKWFETARSVNG